MTQKELKGFMEMLDNIVREEDKIGKYISNYTNSEVIITKFSDIVLDYIDKYLSKQKNKIINEIFYKE